MKIFIKTIRGRITIYVDGSDKISTIKDKIREVLTTASLHEKSNPRLVHRGRVLADDQPLAAAKPPVAENDTLLFIYSLIPPQTDEMDSQPTEEDSMDTSVTIPLAVPTGPALPDNLQSLVNNLVGAFSNSNNANRPPAPAPAPTGPAPSPAATAASSDALAKVLFPELEESLKVFLDMGFPPNRAKKALLLNNCNVSAAMDWLEIHADDADIDQAISEREMQQLFQSKQPAQPPAAATAPIRPPPTMDQQMKRCIAHNRCTFAVTGRNYAAQRWYHCYTCGMMDSEGMCESCKNVCHKGHLVSEPQDASSFYCDCGPSGKCKCCSPPPPE